MTRDELLTAADEAIELVDKEIRRGSPRFDGIAPLSQFAQACIMLAKERRESEQSPTYEQADRAVDVIREIVAAIDRR